MNTIPAEIIKNSIHYILFSLSVGFSRKENSVSS